MSDMSSSDPIALIAASRSFLATTVEGLTDDQLDQLAPLVAAAGTQAQQPQTDLAPYQERIDALSKQVAAIRGAATVAGFHGEAPLDEVIELLARRPTQPKIPAALVDGDRNELFFRLITAVRDAAGLAPITQPWTFDEAFADTLTQLAGHTEVPSLADLDPGRVAPNPTGAPTLEPTVTIPQTLAELNPFEAS